MDDLLLLPWPPGPPLFPNFALTYFIGSGFTTRHKCIICTYVCIRIIQLFVFHIDNYATLNILLKYYCNSPIDNKYAQLCTHKQDKNSTCSSVYVCSIYTCQVLYVTMQACMYVTAYVYIMYIHMHACM